jgi:hypothetical protein
MYASARLIHAVWAGIALPIVVLAACTPGRPPTPSEVPEQTALVFVGDLAESVAHTQSFAWLGEPAQRAESGGSDADLIGEAVRAAVEDEFASRGYDMTEADLADRRLAFGVRSDGDSAELGATFGLSPGLVGSGDASRGTLVLAVLDASGRRILWRGAVQAFADLDGDDDRRRDVLRDGVRRLLRGLPDRTRSDGDS